MRRRPFWLAIALVVASPVSRHAEAGGAKGAVSSAATATTSSERTWSLPADEPPLPPGPGREAFYSACPTCHSTRYLTDQPRLERDTWVSEIDKMQKTYGAQVPPGDAEKILEYVLSVNATSQR